MGEVYKAEHQLLKRPCAIKLIRPEHAGNPKALARFEREVRTTAKLTHPNTIAIYDYGRADDGTFYYVMEFLPGLNLAELLRKNGPLPPARTVHILEQICGALAEAHTTALIHRDIKTSNIFITERGGVQDVAKLLDFGLVKVIDTADSEETQLTQLGSISGTPTYMSPEQAATDGVPGVPSDIYSLGAVAFRMLTGEAPFSGTSMEIMISHVRDKAPSLRAINADIPEELEAVVLKCLEKKPEDRYRSAHALREALLTCQLSDTWTESDAATCLVAAIGRTSCH